MRRIIVTGLIVFSALTLSWVGGAFGQRERGATVDAARTPTPVQVTNFPAVQGVTGTVNVGNLPAVQNVAGTVVMGNLPVDANGDVRVTGGVVVTSTIQFKGFTSSAIAPQGSGNIFSLNRACAAEFPTSRMCTSIELLDSIPAPPVFNYLVWVRLDNPNFAPISSVGCAREDVPDASACGVLTASLPVACCGF